MSRRRALAGMMAVALIGLVYVVVFERQFPAWVRSSGGDVLIVVPVYGTIALARPRWRPIVVAMITFAIACVVEFSQLYHGPMVDAFRRTFVGRMTIGSTFVPSDFACYATGTVAALDFDTLAARRFDRRSTD